MSDFKKYKRKATFTEMRKFHADDLKNPSISINASDALDIIRGKITDGMVARNPKNPSDMWFVSMGYFKENFEAE